MNLIWPEISIRVISIKSIQWRVSKLPKFDIKAHERNWNINSHKCGRHRGVRTLDFSHNENELMRLWAALQSEFVKNILTSVHWHQMLIVWFSIIKHDLYHDWMSDVGFAEFESIMNYDEFWTNLNIFLISQNIVLGSNHETVFDLFRWSHQVLIGSDQSYTTLLENRKRCYVVMSLMSGDMLSSSISC